MRLLCVTPLFPSVDKPYYCIYLLQQLRAFQKIGNDVCVLIPDCEMANGLVKETSFEQMRVIHIGCSFGNFFHIYKFMHHDSKQAISSFVEKYKPDLIALNLCPLELISFFTKYKKKHQIPTVVHFHGLNVWNEFEPKYKLLDSLIAKRKIKVYNKIDGIIGVSQKVCDIVSRHYPIQKIHLVYNGVDPTLFYPMLKKKNDGAFRITCVANLIPIKGHRYLLEGVKKAKDLVKGKTIIVDIIGGGPENNNLSSYCKSLGISDNVYFLGEMDYLDVAKHLRECCDFFIMPSYFESLGCVYLEAMASNVPALGVRGCGIDEIIEDGYSGYLVDPKDSDQICRDIVGAINNPEAFVSVANNGYQLVTSKFTWDDSARQLLTVYHSIIEKECEV